MPRHPFMVIENWDQVLEGTVNLSRDHGERPRDMGVRISLSHTMSWSESALGAQVDSTAERLNLVSTKE